jgi:O-antigen ligase
LLILLCGALAPIKLNVVGELFAAELLLPLVALAVRFSPGGDRGLRDSVFAKLLVASFITLIGYVLSDLVQGTRPDQFLRGWGRVGLIVSDFIALAVIFAQDRRHLWWYALGAGLGSILFLRLVSHAPLALWKFGYADPVLTASAALGVFLPLRAASAWIALLGVYSMWTDFRSFAGMCMVIAGYLWIRAARPTRPLAGSGSAFKLVLAAGSVLVLVLVTLSLTGGSGTGRRNESDAGRRAAFETGIEAVKRSPLIGYGSWAENRELAAMYLNRVNELRGFKAGAAVENGTVFNPHSQILHAWFEGGILGTALLVTMLWQVFRIGGWLVMRRPVDALTPLLFYFAISMLWNLFMSPFTAPHRLGIAIGAAILVMMSIERRGADGKKMAAVDRVPSPAAPVVPPARSAKGDQRQVRYAKRQLLIRKSKRS